MKPGDHCTVNDAGDLIMDAEAAQFIGEFCVFVKVTKGGLYQVALMADQKKEN